MSGTSSSFSETLRRDQQDRWRRGDRVLVESYLQQFPGLANEPQAFLALVLGEYSLREELGESPSVDEYTSRFPSLREQLSQALQRRGGASAGSADTDAASITAQRTGPMACPFCAAALPEVALEELRCPRCRRQIHVVDETATLRDGAPRTIGSFELIERVGRGQFGEVWRARDTRLRREVAIKLPRGPEESSLQAELFLREARASARLRHPNIVPVFEAGSDDGAAYIVTAFVRGATLKQLIEHKTFSPREAALLCRGVAAGLEHAHREGIVHRDLKPSNILIDEEGTPHIADFGLAKHRGLDEITITVQGNIIGTPAYMSPEQARGHARDAGPASDIYSLGVILYQLITGRRPFDGPLQVLMHRILTEAPVPPREWNPQLSRDLETICLKAMAKSPAARYATAAAMAQDLDCFLEGEPVEARRPSLAEQAWRRGRKWWGVAALVLVGCTAGIGLALGLLSDRPEGVSNSSTPALMTPPPEDPPLDAFQHPVLIETEPEGAQVVCYLLDWDTARPQYDRRIEAPNRTPATLILGSGMYLVVAYTDDRFHEVVRTVPRVPQPGMMRFPHIHSSWDPSTGTLRWKRIKLFPRILPEEELVDAPGAAAFDIDLTPLGGGVGRWRVPDFQIEPAEVSVEKFERVQEDLQPGRAKNLAAVDLSWHVAMHYAEARGLRLVDLLEAEWLRTAGGQQKFPWGDKPPPANNWDFDQPVAGARHDRLPTHPAIMGLCSGAFEWTMTRTHVGVGKDQLPGLRYIVYGGPAARIDQKVPLGDWWASVNQYTAHRGLGFRCARSPGPRLAEQDFIAPAP